MIQHNATQNKYSQYCGGHAKSSRPERKMCIIIFILYCSRMMQDYFVQFDSIRVGKLVLWLYKSKRFS